MLELRMLYFTSDRPLAPTDRLSLLIREPASPAGRTRSALMPQSGALAALTEPVLEALATRDLGSDTQARA
jgi:hypothetical protein